MKHAIGYVIDLETAATTMDAVILSIGIVEIDFRALRLTGVEAYWPVTTASQSWRRTDADTLDWWSRQCPTAYAAAFADPSATPLLAALNELVRFMVEPGPFPAACAVYGCGPEFDIAILNHALTQYALPAPWVYNAARCVRTLLDVAGLPKGPFLPGEIEHHALHDARREAREVVDALKFLQQRIAA